jgi:hypothetical protein
MKNAIGLGPGKAKKLAEKPKLNRQWHLAHPMPKNPSLEQRIEWHIEHSRQCNCREIPESIKQEIAKRKIKI